MTHKLLSLIAAVGWAALASGVAHAQDNDQYPPTPPYSDSLSLVDRINRLEHDLSLLQRQVYRGGAPAARPGTAGPADQPATATMEVRFEQLDEQLRDLNGRIEEVTHGIDLVKGRLDKLAGDVDQRLKALEQANAGQANPPNVAAQPNNPAVPAPPAAAAAPSPDGDEEAVAPPDRQRPIVLIPPGQQRPGLNATPSSGPPGPPASDQMAMAAPPDAPGTGTLQAGTSQQQYDLAFGLLREANYSAAELALRDFVRRYPGNPLAGNAQYWLAETFYVRGRYDAAAAAFAEGYEKYPKGPKAAETLLKLGSSLVKLGRKADACQAFARLDRDFPIAQANVKEREAEERHTASCA